MTTQKPNPTALNEVSRPPAKKKTRRNPPKPKEIQPSTSSISTRGVNIDFQTLAGELDSEIDTSICSVCERVNGDAWFGCDYCERWYHRQCLSSVEQIDVDMSCIVPDVKFKCAICKRKSMRICGCCFVNDVKNENWVNCVVCHTSFHRKCVPASFLSSDKFYCFKCNNES